MEKFFNTVESVYLFFRDIGVRLSPLKHLAQDLPGFRPEKFEKVLKNIKPVLIHKTSTHWIVRCTLGEEVRETNIFLLRPFDPARPSITFHHGAGQINHMLPATFILGSEIMDTCNVFVIKAQKHGSTYEYLSESVDSFYHQQQTFAGSVLATQEIVKYHKLHSKKSIVVSGASMGGIVSSLHAYFFGTGDFYVPLTAYSNVGEIFMGPAYKTGVFGWEEKRHRKEYLASYRIKKPFRANLKKRIFPVLGRFDSVVAFSKANEFWKSQGISPKVFPYGHFASFIVRAEIRKIILQLIAN